MSSNKAQILYIPHGGGPLPLLSDPGHEQIINFLREIPTKLHRPDLILVISGTQVARGATNFLRAKRVGTD